MLRPELGGPATDLTVDRMNPDREAVQEPVHGIDAGRTVPRWVDDRLRVRARGNDDIVAHVFPKSPRCPEMERVAWIEQADQDARIENRYSHARCRSARNPSTPPGHVPLRSAA
jgi:hypothetical protein